ncbi:MAG: MurR/RpiR family transcriptional regulator, partial [Angelakisella sp.]
DFITKHYEKAAFMTAAKLGDTVGVSESTVVRFATEVGFEGYPQLQKNLQEIIRNRLTTVQRMEIIDGQIGNADILTKVMTLDSEKIRHTLEEIDRDSFSNAVDAIIAADERYILGIRSSNMLANFVAFYFNHIFEHVHNVSNNSTSEVFEQMLRIKDGDVLVAISFPRYSQRTLKAARFAKSCGAKVIAITDSISAPLAEVADIMLLARSDMASFVDSLVAPLSLINALIVALGLRKKEEISK